MTKSEALKKALSFITLANKTYNPNMFQTTQAGRYIINELKLNGYWISHTNRGLYLKCTTDKSYLKQLPNLEG
jgi:hypothetical protein